MTANEIRKSFLKFFEEHGHRIVPSASVVPYDDPTLLFTNAGMNQFKDVFLGTGKREYVRAADSQKCIRVSGKHNDLEEVGRDTYHHTFFEMLGNWSFGDYYKSEAIEWAWELLTKVWGLEKKRLYATVFETDDESDQLWKKVTDIDPSHVLRFEKKDNFWEMGETGPCGPCSEIHIDLTEDLSGGKLVNAGDPRVMEIWNLVFIQYDRDAAGKLTPLPAKHVDTGMGFERICAVLQGKKSNYDTDVFSPIIKRIEEITGKSYAIADSNLQSEINNPQSEINIAMRVIADHVRMLSFSIADGAIPSNEKRGSVLRRILHRAAFHGRQLEIFEPFLFKIVDAVTASMSMQYPELTEKQDLVKKVVKAEEERYESTLDRGLPYFENVVGNLAQGQYFPGFEAFYLSTTMGVGPDDIKFWADQEGLTIDWAAYDYEMKKHSEKSRGEGKSRFTRESDEYDKYLNDFVQRRETELLQKHGLQKLRIQEKDIPPTAFRGYTDTETTARIILDLGNNIFLLDKTTFYVQSGGQVNDTGVIEGDSFVAKVVDVFKRDNKIFHKIELTSGSSHPNSDQLVTVRVDKPRRRNIERNHTATHLVHEALRRVLGEHLHQQGSLVAPDHLRFDFNHFDKITPAQLKAIEEIVNEKISQSIDVIALNDPKDWLTIEEAKKKYPNVKMFFGEKYGDKVRVVQVPSFCAELCGGTHVKNTKDIGLFKIVSESSIASGIRRIEAVTGEGLNQYIQKQRARIGELDERLARLVEEQEQLKKELGVEKQHKLPPATHTVEIISHENITTEDVAGIELMAAQREELIEQVTKSTNELKKELSKVRVKGASSTIDTIVANSVPIDGFRVASGRIEASSMDELKSFGDTLRSKLSSGIGVLGAVVDEKAALVCVVTDDLIKNKKLQAGKIVGELAKLVGGGGGGRPHLATAGGKDISKLDEALRAAPSIIQSMIQR
ncbi:MAG: alanine--tRNA ligase [Bacteroidota bacterium]|jgi:alanyl-tRNA synthetase